jgi:hypothetical protein
MYSPLQDLGPTSFAALPGLFASLDTSGDDWLDRQELAGLVTIDPHIELSVAFEKGGGDGAASAEIEICKHAPEVKVLSREAADRVVLALGPTRLVISAADVTPPAESTEMRADVAHTQLRLMVHDQGDALLSELDVDFSGQLSEREIAAAPVRLLARDDDGDGSVASGELPYAMIVAFLRGERLNENTFYMPPSGARRDRQTQPPAWFGPADLNQDGDVSRREFIGSADQFALLDASGDGYIDAGEAGGAEASRETPP